jgi:hypothetical protein
MAKSQRQSHKHEQDIQPTQGIIRRNRKHGLTYAHKVLKLEIKLVSVIGKIEFHAIKQHIRSSDLIISEIKRPFFFGIGYKGRFIAKCGKIKSDNAFCIIKVKHTFCTDDKTLILNAICITITFNLVVIVVVVITITLNIIVVVAIAIIVIFIEILFEILFHAYANTHAYAYALTHANANTNTINLQQSNVQSRQRIGIRHAHGIDEVLE